MNPTETEREREQEKETEDYLRVGRHRGRDVRGGRCLLTHEETTGEIMENLSAYLPFRHIRFMASDCGIWRENGKLREGQGILSWQLVRINIRYLRSPLIRDALAYIYDYVSAVTLVQMMVDIAVGVESRHTDR